MLDGEIRRRRPGVQAGGEESGPSPPAGGGAICEGFLSPLDVASEDGMVVHAAASEELLSPTGRQGTGSDRAPLAGAACRYGGLLRPYCYGVYGRHLTSE